ncbi:LuxR family transcriptional regulator [Kibdelosporangium aridum]|uniref:LuxR family transcriptional regulator n=1 Tax=Kibdelosporangium aridum TaxID=2030 RepID=A0A428Z1S8_KIBAR|nr:LuxR family transcriptional regulator [Kibdelosporangium aridum]RSM78989.1 LuxR family transcriptional regulator [Kibdelosporangium aridum]
MAAQWPFTGREDELTLLSGRLAAGLVVAGSIGVGKSRLLAEAFTRAPRDFAPKLVEYDALPVVGDLRTAANALVAEVAPRRLLLGIDDAHLLADSSAALIQHVVQNRAASVVLTIRAGERAPDAIVALWKDRLLDRIDLAAPTEPQTGALLERVLAGPVTAGTIRLLHSRANGNMAVLAEMVQAGLADGALAKVAGVWRWRGEPGALDRDVTEAERDVLELVARNEPVCVDTLTDLDTVDSLIHDGRLTLHDDCVRLTDPLKAEAIRAAAGQRPRSAQELLAAAHEATAALDFVQAERFAWQAAEAGDPIGAAEVLWRVVSLRDLTRAPEMDEMLARLLRKDLTDRQAATLAYRRAFLLFWFLDRTSDAIDLLGETKLRVADRQCRDELSVLEALFMLYRPDPRAALDRLTPLSDHVPAKLGTGMALVLLGRPMDAVPALQFQVGHDELPGLDLGAAMFRCYALLMSGDLPAAEHAAEELYQTALAGEWHWNAALAHALLSQMVRFRGNLTAARRILADGLSLYHSGVGGGTAFASLLFAEVATVRALSGDPEGASTALAEADRTFRPSQAVHRFWLEMARPWVANVAGDRAEAIRLAGRAAEVARECGADAYEMLALYDIVRLGAPDLAVNRMAELRCQSAFFDALRAHDAAAFSELGACLYAAEAAIQAAQADRRAVSAYRAARLAENCPGTHFPELSTLDVPRLSERERTIGRLAAAGQSSRAIAERFTVSPRTVENHLQRLYTKLGLRGRDDLGEWL